MFQFRAYTVEFTLASRSGLTDGKEVLRLRCGTGSVALSCTNEGGQGRRVGRDVDYREISLSFPKWTRSVNGQQSELGSGAPPYAGSTWKGRL